MIRVLEESPAVSYILDSKFRFVYMNPAWDSFAVSNGAPQLAGEALIGCNLIDTITDALKPVYTEAFRQVSRSAGTWEKTYHCSSPEQARKYRMKIYFMERRKWYLVTNSLLAQRPHRNSYGADDGAYFSHGIVTMCAHCRCSRRVDGSDRWEFVPDYLRLKGLQTLSVSHALCPVCQEHFYPRQGAAD
jgi:hypothetical protein